MLSQEIDEVYTVADMINGTHRVTLTDVSLTDLVLHYAGYQLPCFVCGQHEPKCKCEEQIWHSSFHNPIRGKLFAFGPYRGKLKQAILKMKYNNKPVLGEVLADMMAEVWLDLYGDKQKLTVVPIPLHPEKLRQRGFNQAEVIARRFARYLNWPMQAQGLERIRETEAQFRLSPSQRQQNLQDAFAVGKAFSHRHPKTPVLLVDDIYTTGATIKAAAKVLRSSGIEVYGAATLAATVRQ